MFVDNFESDSIRDVYYDDFFDRFFTEEEVINKMNSSNLERIKIFGLFGRYDVEMQFNKEVNIYIGENGLGKTTILNCVYYILSKRYLKLSEIDFKEIAIKFVNERNEIKITIDDLNLFNAKRMPRRNYYDEEYVEFLLQELIVRKPDIDIYDEYEIDMLIRKLSHAAGIPSSIARRQILHYLKTGEIYLTKKEKNGNAKKVEELNTIIDNNIKQKILYLTTYRRIEDDFSKLINNEEKIRESNDTLIKFGMSDVDRSIIGMLDNIRENSRESFNKMAGVLLKQYSSEDEKHFNSDNKYIDKDMLRIILDRLGNEIEQEDRDRIIFLLDSNKIYDDKYIYLLDLISKLIENYDKQKVLDEKIKNFAKTCNKYLNGKKFVYNQSELTLPVKLETSEGEFKETIKLTNLSSGEKQIVSLFSKLYLDNEKDSILIIDEPELSLSMEWQKMLLPDIMRSGNCKLLLTVTHSPFIFDNEFDNDAKEMHACITETLRG